MLTQRRSSSAVCGYSSLSIMFLSADSAIRMSASGSIHVVTKVARLSRALPSSISSSWMIWNAVRGCISLDRQLVARDPVHLARRRELRAELDVVVVVVGALQRHGASSGAERHLVTRA